MYVRVHVYVYVCMRVHVRVYARVYVRACTGAEVITCSNGFLYTMDILDKNKHACTLHNMYLQIFVVLFNHLVCDVILS